MAASDAISPLRKAYLELRQAEHDAEWGAKGGLEKAWQSFEEEIKKLCDSSSKA